MKTLTTWFEVMDLFGGDTETVFGILYYADALKLAEAKGFTFSSELYQEATQNCLMS
jgi:hypothetical protein